MSETELLDAAAVHAEPLRRAVLAGRFVGRENADTAARLAELCAGGLSDRAWSEAWFGAEATARLVLAPDDLRCLIDRDIAAIDELISAQLDAILHAPRMRRLEGSWRGLAWLIGMIDPAARIKVRLLPIAWPELCRDLERAADFDQSNLFKRVYEDEFGTPGGEPFGLLLIDHEVRHQPGPGSPTDDVTAMATLAGIAAASFSPVVLSASPSLLEVDGFEDLALAADPGAPLRAASHMRWRSLAAREDMRFLCVAMPRVLARRPWGDEAYCRFRFRYVEHAPNPTDRVWMTAGFAFAFCVARAFASHAWPADVRGVETDVEGGGVVPGLPSEWFATDPPHVWVRPALDLVLTDRQERLMVDAGLMPVTALPFGEEVAFGAVRSMQTPNRYTAEAATANARLSAQINSMLCVGRFAHFLKVMGRDMVGSMQTADTIERRLQGWLAAYVNSSISGGRDTRAKYPLLAGRVSVSERPGKPGVFGCVIQLQPHFQLDDVSATFRLVTDISAPGLAGRG